MNRRMPAIFAVNMSCLVIVLTGVVAVVTVTCAVRVMDPPVPEQSSENVVVESSGPTDSEPLVDLLPLHPFDATQEVAFVDVQFSSAFWP